MRSSFIMSVVSFGLLFTAFILNFIILIKARRVLRRNSSVAMFRIYVLDKYPEIYESLPSYEEMMIDKKPLTLESYLSPEQLNILLYESNVH